jgi:hypothetical protein
MYPSIRNSCSFLLQICKPYSDWKSGSLKLILVLQIVYKKIGALFSPLDLARKL